MDKGLNFAVDISPFVTLILLYDIYWFSGWKLHTENEKLKKISYLAIYNLEHAYLSGFGYGNIIFAMVTHLIAIFAIVAYLVEFLRDEFCWDELFSWITTILMVIFLVADASLAFMRLESENILKLEILEPVLKSIYEDYIVGICVGTTSAVVAGLILDKLIEIRKEKRNKSEEK